jgi:hypothetical protein
MYVMIMLTDYTEAQFQAAQGHLAQIREQNPDMGFNFIGCPKRNESLEKRLIESGHVVKQFLAYEFMNWHINSVSTTLN